MNEPRVWWVYIIATSNATLYTGIALDPERRFAEHSAAWCGVPGARGAKYFRLVQPLELVYREAHPSRGEASRREAAIKKLPLREKWRLVQCRQ